MLHCVLSDNDDELRWNAILLGHINYIDRVWTYLDPKYNTIQVYMQTNDGRRYSSAAMLYNDVMTRIYSQESECRFEVTVRGPDGEQVALEIAGDGKTVLSATVEGYEYIDVGSPHERQMFVMPGLQQRLHYGAWSDIQLNNERKMITWEEWKKELEAEDMSDDTSEIDKFLDEFVIKEETGGGVSNEPN